MNLAWFTGKISEAEMEDEHPLELEDIRRRALAEAGSADEDLPPPAPATDPSHPGDTT